MVGSESDIDCAQPRKSSEKEPRSDDQQRGQRNLKADQSLAAHAFVPPRRGLRILFEAMVQLRARRVQGRSQAEQNSGQRRDAYGKCKDRPVKMDVKIRMLPRIGDHPGQDVASEIAGDQPSGAAKRRQQEALHEQLANDASAARAQRQPYAHLALSLCSARQHQVGNIHPPEQQHQANQNHQHCHGPGELLLLFKQAAAAIAQVELGKILAGLERHGCTHDGGQFGVQSCLCRGVAHARPDSAH